MPKIIAVRVVLQFEDGEERTYIDERVPNVKDIEYAWETDIITEYGGASWPTKRPGPNKTVTIKYRK